jgi:ABC-type molybdate transport system substrate-binding protein
MHPDAQIYTRSGSGSKNPGRTRRRIIEGKVTVFSAGVHAGAKEPAAAKALIQFLSSPASAPVARKKGMEPA